MADDLSKRQPQDADRVNVNEAWELRYWTARFKVSDEELRAAIKAVGPMARDIERHLGRSHSSTGRA